MKKTKNNIANIYPLSPMQTGMFFHFLKDQDPQSYLQQIAWRIQGKFDQQVFEKSWNRLIARHDILRTNFIYKNTPQPLQVVTQERKINLTSQRLDAMCAQEKEEIVQEIRGKQRKQPFRLDQDLLLRLHLIDLGNNEYEAILTHHHIIMDGWSLGQLVKESLDHYVAILNNREAELSVPVSFSSYINWLKKQDEENSRQFWQEKLCTIETPCTPIANHRPHITTAPQAINFHIEESELKQLSNIAKECHITLNTIFQGIWALLLGRYNNTTDIVFGNVVSGRPQDLDQIENMAGIFINSVPVCAKLTPNISLESFFQSLQQDTLLSEAHQYLCLADIQAQSPLKDRLIGSLYVMENYPLDDLFELGRELPDCGFCVTRMDTWEKTHFDFGIRLLPDRGMNIKIGFNPAKYHEKQMTYLAQHLQNALRYILKNGTDVKLSEIDFIGEDEKHEIASFGKKETLIYDTTQSIVERFRQQAKQTPTAPCLVFGRETHSYEQVNRVSDQIAARLQHRLTITPNTRIALIMERGIPCVLAILGILKSGAAYVALEADTPTERRNFILEDSAALALISDQVLDELPNDLTLLSFNELTTGKGKPSQSPSPNDLAYVIYTSGTTGTPKGVMIEHKSVVHLAHAMNGEIYSRHNRKLNMVLLTTYVFDGSVQQIFSALLYGHCLHIMDDETKRTPHLFTRFMQENNIDVAGCVPNFLALLKETGELPALKKQLSHMIFGGEALPVHLANAVLCEPDAPLLTNLYGPSECCVNATTYTAHRYEEGPESSLTIGAPLGNSEILILDRQGYEQPLGAIGELCISGIGLARGYLNNPELSAEKFTTHPHDPNKRIYHTGDLARWRLDGNLDFLGRIDQQVKINGFRIEPEEIEKQINQHPHVSDCCVVAPTDHNNRSFLRACITLHQELDKRELRQELAAKLPPHMIPSQFIYLETLPRLVSGKFDRKSMTDLICEDIQSDQNRPVIGPKNDSEQALLDAWSDVFGRSDISTDDDYFALGGDSIRAIQILSKLYQKGFSLQLKDLFNHPTIASLAPHLTQDTFQEEGPITGNIPLTPAQARFFKKFSSAHHWFNHALMLQTQTSLDPVNIEKALEILTTHHDAFRLRYHKDANGNWQQDAPAGAKGWDFQYLDLSDHDQPDQAISRAASLAHTGINLEKGPLAKAILFSTQSGDQLLLVIHHLIIDGVSWRILLDDFNTVYQNLSQKKEVALPPKSRSLKTWGNLLAKFSQSTAFAKEIPYWQAIEHADVSPFPVEMPSPNNRFCDVQTQSLLLDKKLTKLLLGKVNHAFNTNTEEILLCGLGRALYRWKKVESTILTMEGHGRNAPFKGGDINRTIGWFTSIYPVVLALPHHDTIAQQIKSLKENMRHIPNKGFGYAILKHLFDGAFNSNPSFENHSHITFNYLGQFTNSQDDGAFQVQPYDGAIAIAPSAKRSSDIDVSAMVLTDQMEINLSYSTHRFLESSMEVLLQHMKTELQTIADFCLERDTRELTPSDLTLSGISLDELESLF